MGRLALRICYALCPLAIFGGTSKTGYGNVVIVSKVGRYCTVRCSFLCQGYIRLLVKCSPLSRVQQTLVYNNCLCNLPLATLTGLGRYQNNNTSTITSTIPRLRVLIRKSRSPIPSPLPDTHHEALRPPYYPELSLSNLGSSFAISTHSPVLSTHSLRSIS